MRRDARRGMVIKILLVWLGLLMLAGFSFGMRSGDHTRISGVIFPQVPQSGQPVMAIFRVNNPESQPSWVEYHLYLNGALVMEESRLMPARSSQRLEYVYRNSLEPGQMVVFLLKAKTEHGEFEKMVAQPPYPPQVMSSFVSFASFSSAVFSSSMSSSMNVIATQGYYQKSFGRTSLNVGLIVSLVLVGLLILLELIGPVIKKDGFTVKGRFKLTFGRLSIALLVIFMGLVFTRVTLVIWPTAGAAHPAANQKPPAAEQTPAPNNSDSGTPELKIAELDSGTGTANNPGQ